MNGDDAAKAQADYVPGAHAVCEGFPLNCDYDAIDGCERANCSEIQKSSETVLQEASRITSSDRNKTYGPPRDNHTRTAELWSAYLGVPITYRQVCWMNVLQKASRDANAPGRDNLVDGCGFLRNIEMADNDEGR